MSAMSSQITSLTVVYSSVYSGADQRKHQSYASLAFVLGIHRWPVNSSHKGPVTRKIFRLMTSSWEVEMCATRGFLYYWWLRLFTVITLYVTLSLTSPKESNAISSSIGWLYYITNAAQLVAEIILGEGSVSERRRYNVTSPLIGWTHT